MEAEESNLWTIEREMYCDSVEIENPQERRLPLVYYAAVLRYVS
jgi:hypothetical protein